MLCSGKSTSRTRNQEDVLGRSDHINFCGCRNVAESRFVPGPATTQRLSTKGRNDALLHNSVRLHERNETHDFDEDSYFFLAPVKRNMEGLSSWISQECLSLCSLFLTQSIHLAYGDPG